MFDGYYLWLGIDIKQYWMEIMDLWYSEGFRGALLKDSAIGCPKVEDDCEPALWSMLPWNSLNSNWVTSHYH